MKLRRFAVIVLLSGLVISGCGNKKVDELIQSQNEKEDESELIDLSNVSDNMVYDNQKESVSQNKNSVIQNQVSENQIVSNVLEVKPENDAQNKKNEQSSDVVDIDIDLTTMSATMVYSEVYNIMCYPDEYRDKCIRMNGTCSIYEDVVTGQLYYACIIQDATKCCQQGIEFNLQDSYVFPDDYPENGEEVSVVGMFETYAEDGVLYCRLRDAVLCD